MKRGFHFFEHGIEVDCSANPFDPSPAADAITAEIANIRKHSNRPIFVLAGELHDSPEQVLLPFAFMLRNGLLSSTSPSALLSQFQMSLEFPHYRLAKFLHGYVGPTPSDSQTINRIVESDFTGERLLHNLQMTRYYRSPHARYFLHEALLDGKIRVSANDAAWCEGQPAILDSTDDPTRSLIRLFGYDEADSITAESPAGMLIRNFFTAGRLEEQGMKSGMVTWHQAGTFHIVGHKQLAHKFHNSLARSLYLTVCPNAHIITVLPVHETGFSEENIPDAAVGCTSTVIGVRGLSQPLPATTAEEFIRSNEAICAIFNSAGKTPKRKIPLPHLQPEDYRDRYNLIVSTLYPQWEAAARDVIGQKKSGSMAPALS